MAEYQERVILKVDGDSTGLKNSLTSTAFSFNQIVESAKNVSGILKTVTNAIKSCVAEYKLSEQAGAKLNAVVKATGNQVGMTSKELQDFASEMQQVSTFGDDAYMSLEQMFIATQSLNEDGLKRAVKLTSDLASAMGTDLTSAGNLLQMALQDPAEGLSRLRRSGIAFTDEEKEQIKALADAGDQMSAQSLILDKLEGKYQGVAKAVADTDTGKLEQIGNTLGDIKEDLGQGILDAVSPALNTIYNWLVQIEGWAKKNVDSSSIINGVKRGDLNSSDYTVEQLQNALDNFKQSDRYKKGYGQDIVTDLEQIIEWRKKDTEALKEYETELAKTQTLEGGGNSSTSTNGLSDFISSNAGSSLTQQKKDLQAIIDDAEKWKGTVAEGSEEYQILDEIITSTKEQQDALFDTEAVISWSDVFSTGLQSVMSGLEDCMESLVLGEASWGSFAKAGLEAIASILESLGSQLTAQAVVHLLEQDYAGFGIATAGALGCYAGAGLVRGLAGKFEYGGIVGGTGITGDKHMIFANAGELILSKAQQGAIAGQLQGANSSFSPTIQFNGNVFGDRESIAEFVYDGIKEAQRQGVISKW